MPKSGKFTFTIKNIDTVKLEKLYGINTDISNSVDEENDTTNINEITTKLSDLNKNNKLIVSFLDETKTTHSCNISMIDINNIESKQDYNCFWCKNKFDTQPIGCPIRYVPKQGVKTYYSHISKDSYNIKEDLTDQKFNDLKSDPSFKLKNSYYETDGIFCSFNCCKAYINNNKHNKVYNKSLILLNKMYYDITGEYCTDINDAPDWRLLKDYGGYLDIEDFRNGFNKIKYEYQGTTSYNDYKPITHMYEETLLF